MPTLMNETLPTARITHMEIRRVQNGYVVAVYDLTHDRAMGYQRPQVASYVAVDAAELGRLVETLATGTEIEWLSSTELPMMDYHHMCHKKESPG